MVVCRPVTDLADERGQVPVLTSMRPTRVVRAALDVIYRLVVVVVVKFQGGRAREWGCSVMAARAVATSCRSALL